MLDDLLQKARVTIDPATRADIYKEVQQRIYDQDHDVILWFRNGSIGAQPKVGGLDTIVHPNGSNLQFHKVWLRACDNNPHLNVGLPNDPMYPFLGNSYA